MSISGMLECSQFQQQEGNMSEKIEQMPFKIKAALGIIFATQAGAILSGVKFLENIGYTLAIFIVIIRLISIAGVLVVPEDNSRKMLNKIQWHWVMSFPTFAMAASGWIATAIVYAVTEFVFMIIAYRYKESEGKQ